MPRWATAFGDCVLMKRVVKGGDGWRVESRRGSTWSYRQGVLRDFQGIRVRD